jgi:predicted RNase H-like HicB family nuclease
MRQRRYSVVLIPEPEEGGYSVVVPSLPGCVTQGETIEEAIAMAQDAIAGWILVAEKHGEPVPEEHEPPTIVTVNVAA